MGNSDAKQPDSWDGWNAVPTENSQGTAQWKETADSSNKDWKADGWGAKSGNRSTRTTYISPRAKEQEQKNSRNGSDLPIISMTTVT